MTPINRDILKKSFKFRRTPNMLKGVEEKDYCNAVMEEANLVAVQNYENNDIETERVVSKEDNMKSKLGNFNKENNSHSHLKDHTRVKKTSDLYYKTAEMATTESNNEMRGDIDDINNCLDNKKT